MGDCFSGTQISNLLKTAIRRASTSAPGATVHGNHTDSGRLKLSYRYTGENFGALQRVYGASLRPDGTSYVNGTNYAMEEWGFERQTFSEWFNQNYGNNDEGFDPCYLLFAVPICWPVLCCYVCCKSDKSVEVTQQHRDEYDRYVDSVKERIISKAVAFIEASDADLQSKINRVTGKSIQSTANGVTTSMDDIAAMTASGMSADDIVRAARAARSSASESTPLLN